MNEEKESFIDAPFIETDSELSGETRRDLIVLMAPNQGEKPAPATPAPRGFCPIFIFTYKDICIYISALL